ncbi:MAG TPA: CCA tRNA nucleotidyltransferase [Lacipirellulaceae bacterium]
MPETSAQHDFALQIVEKLRAAGFEALWAGGCVRDQLLGIEPKDYDVATSAKPDEIRNLFGHRRTLAIGVSFGVITVLGPRSAGQIEVATFRTDAAYSDGRHPDSVTFTTAQNDAARRDFTINGLFFDPIASEVVDYVGGREDLERKTVRAIGDPAARIAEDKLRMLRAIRFAAAFGFEIEPNTLRAIEQSAAEVTNVSPERIGMEIRRMLVDRHRVIALNTLRETNLLVHVLPEVARLDGPRWQDTRRVLATLSDPTLPLALAALLWQVTSPAAVNVVGRRLRYTNKEIELAAWLLAQLETVATASELPWPRLQRVLIHDGAAELVEMHAAIAGPDDPAVDFCRQRLAWPPERLNPPPLVDGAALIAHGLTPGPTFSRLLELVRDAQLRNETATPAEALVFVDRILLQGLDAPP